MCCFSLGHSVDECPSVETAVCEYCNARGHLVTACFIMQGVCTICYKRGHTTGNCNRVDEEKWWRLKGKGGLSYSNLFTYAVDKRAVVNEVLAAFGKDLDLKFLPPHLRKWILEEKCSAATSAFELPAHWATVIDRFHCKCCYATGHSVSECFFWKKAVCEYCGASGHLIIACPVMQGLCKKCFKRGHR
jgi:hypothetical protein